VFKATINNISVISWRSVFLIKETQSTRESHRQTASFWQTLSLSVVSSTPRQEQKSNSPILMATGIVYIGRCTLQKFRFQQENVRLYIGYSRKCLLYNGLSTTITIQLLMLAWSFSRLSFYVQVAWYLQYTTSSFTQQL
jgi:hypothetical protein